LNAIDKYGKILETFGNPKRKLISQLPKIRKFQNRAPQLIRIKQNLPNLKNKEVPLSLLKEELRKGRE